MRRWVVGVVMGAIVLTVSSCGSKLPEASSSAADRFYHAIEVHDAAAACGLLAPQTRHEVEQSAQTSCSAAILDEDIPAAGTVVELRKYGTQAYARMNGDTAFLAEFGDGWKIVAAACIRHDQMPYDCKVKG
ncbi:hypothetical protein [Kribbella jiaozuonensis]|uniref:Lipoprotein n=1 Tax=Kribbella jiaozuonensis TaxID=2575441 RepID=A0A4U3LL11_9ACTN|nr:hypothetical protein [Kribbella jiaozuonensis]TKK76172.1 hypothetical protein FDA38_27550 [Kribbella jiaozuonensis]